MASGPMESGSVGLGAFIIMALNELTGHHRMQMVAVLVVLCWFGLVTLQRLWLCVEGEWVWVVAGKSAAQEMEHAGGSTLSSSLLSSFLSSFPPFLLFLVPQRFTDHLHCVGLWGEGVLSRLTAALPLRLSVSPRGLGWSHAARVPQSGGVSWVLKVV